MFEFWFEKIEKFEKEFELLEMKFEKFRADRKVFYQDRKTSIRFENKFEPKIVRNRSAGIP